MRYGSETADLVHHRSIAECFRCSERGRRRWRSQHAHRHGLGPVVFWWTGSPVRGSLALTLRPCGTTC